MTDVSWFDALADGLAANWPWVAGLFLFLSYELWALYTQYAHHHWPETVARPSFLITLSRMYWRTSTRYAFVTPIVLGVLAWLVPHLMIGDTAVAWAWTVVLWLVIAVSVIRKQVTNG